MSSLVKDCQELKETYEKCFNSWFTEHFLKGDTSDPCAPVFVQYQKCVKAAVKNLKIDIPPADYTLFENLNEPNSKQ